MKILDIKGWKVFYKKNPGQVADVRFSVLAGSEKEDREEIHGVAHFVEHLLFKGTEKRGYQEISDDTAAIGGQSNAFTARSLASYYIRVIVHNWSAAFEILADMLFHSVFDEKEIEKERNVILEEAKSSIDDPETYILEEGVENTLSRPRGHRIIGSMESIASLKREDMIDFMKKHYHGGNVLISVVGNIEEEELRGVLESSLPEAPPGEKVIYREEEPSFNNQLLKLHRENLQQAYLITYYEGVGREHPLYYPQKVLFNTLGGGMHSLLFKVIREEQGLCYSIGAGDVCSFNDESLVCVNTNLNASNIDKTRTLVDKILKEVQEKGVDKKLLEISKIEYTSYVAMSTETSSGYILYYGMNHLLDRFQEFEELYDKIHRVSNEEIMEAARLIFKNPKETSLS